MKRALITLTALTLALLMVGCATITVTPKTAKYEKPLEFYYVHDFSEPKNPSGMVRIKQEMDEREAERQAEAEAEAAAEEEYYEEYWEPVYESYSGSGGGMQGNPDGLNSRDGVYDYNGKTESFYASHAVYDSELTVDDEGFYRSGDYYVVASSDYAQGTVIETSQGEAIVMDDGADNGVIDFHVTWGR